MARRHFEVDPATQGSFLPLHSGQLAVGSAMRQEEIEGGFYVVPAETAPPAADSPVAAEVILTPEEQKAASLKAEDTALDFLSRAEETEAKITAMKRGRYALHRAGRDQAKQTQLTRAIERSTDTYRRFGRVAQTQYARSIGIEKIHEATTNEFDEYEGRFRDVITVHAVEPEQDRELQLGWRSFTDTFDTEQRRVDRRQEIQAELEAPGRAEAA